MTNAERPAQLGTSRNLQNDRRRIFKREMAMMVYEKHERQPPSAEEQNSYMAQQKGFLRVPDEFTYCGNHLSHGEKVTWLALFSCNWDKNPFYRVSWPSKKWLAIVIGTSERQVTQYLNGLISKGILLKRKQMNRPNLYLLWDPPRRWMQETKSKLEQLKGRPEEERE